MYSSYTGFAVTSVGWMRNRAAGPVPPLLGSSRLSATGHCSSALSSSGSCSGWVGTAPIGGGVARSVGRGIEAYSGVARNIPTWRPLSLRVGNGTVDTRKGMANPRSASE